ncbi:MAG TPA: 6-phosphogluconolactonase [Microbacteriaceae bacterium]|nr:6-phosphogluconolactonase [Microbacteriaceae bacterium]HRA09118.1 6-phosphogluconolactonase [Microbacteriaceae bacterium]
MAAERDNERSVLVRADLSAVADLVAGRVIGTLAQLTEERATVHIALTGGRGGAAVLSAIAAHPWRDNINWARVHLWWSDERFVPAADPERNEVLARAALIDSIDIPARNVHAISASDAGIDVDAAADAYANELAGFAPVGGDPWPSFDITLLGVGPDGHYASLFPERPEINVTDRTALAVRDSPKPPPTRVTLTRPVINASQRVWLVLSGADKAAVLGLALAGASYSHVPASGAKGRLSTVFFVDEAAAAEVPLELIAQDQ